MSAEPITPFDERRICTRPAHCPVCAQPNQCRLETGEAYKGPCWCERPTLPAAAFRRLTADLPEPRCLCPTCLETLAHQPEVTWEELAAPAPRPPVLVPQEGDSYLENGCIVFTAQYHLRRGACCGSGCRHCPFRVNPGNEATN